jgi:hypothetical protein
VCDYSELDGDCACLGCAVWSFVGRGVRERTPAWMRGVVPAHNVKKYHYGVGNPNARMFGPDAIASIWLLSNTYVIGDAFQT